MELLETRTPSRAALSRLRRNNSKRSSSCQSPARALLSIKPRFAEAIFCGDKRFEFRRIVFTQNVGVVVVYVTSPVCRVWGEFDVRAVINDEVKRLWGRTHTAAGIERDLFFAYFAGRTRGYAIEIGQTRRYSRPLNLGAHFGVRAPQSFLYLD